MYLYLLKLQLAKMKPSVHLLVLLLAAVPAASFTLEMMGRRGRGNLKRELSSDGASFSKKKRGNVNSLNQGKVS